MSMSKSSRSSSSSSTPTISSPPTPNSLIHDVKPLQFTKRRPKTPGPQDNRASSAPQNHNRIPLSDSTNATIQQMPSSAHFLADPAFSSDPFHHPDHHELPLSLALGKKGPSMGLFTAAEVGPPPAYTDSAPPSEPLQRHLRVTAQAYHSPTSSPSSGSHDLPQTPEDTQGDTMEPEEELLAYLQDDISEANDKHQCDVNIPMSLRPHMGLPVMSQPQTAPERRVRAGPDTTALTRSATSPPTTRTVSEPLMRTNTERPRLPRRGNTASPRRIADLDRIDELDETTPLGLPLHHRGPYELEAKVDNPPMPVMPHDGERKRVPRQHILVAETPASVPPAPVPFKLDLKPGEFLTRVPPARGRTLTPEQNASPGILQPAYEQRRYVAQDQFSQPSHHQSNEYKEWSPEQLYEDRTFAPTQMVARDDARHPYRSDNRNYTPSSSPSTSRSDIRMNMGSNSDLNHAQPRRQSQIPFQQVPQQPSQLSRSISQPACPQSSSASAYSSSLSVQTRAPLPPSDRTRPKRIVMPAPLQQQNQNYMRPVPSDTKYRQDNMSPQPTAAVIPVHDPKKNNMLKKRASTSASTHQNHKHLLPERASSTKGFFGLGGSFRKGLTQEPESNFPKSNRKLSKRGKAA